MRKKLSHRVPVGRSSVRIANLAIDEFFPTKLRCCSTGRNEGRQIFLTVVGNEDRPIAKLGDGNWTPQVLIVLVNPAFGEGSTLVTWSSVGLEPGAVARFEVDSSRITWFED